MEYQDLGWSSRNIRATFCNRSTLRLSVFTQAERALKKRLEDCFFTTTNSLERIDSSVGKISCS